MCFGRIDSGLFDFWLRFGSVTGFFKPAPSPKPRQKPKILAPHRYIFSVNALKSHCERVSTSPAQSPGFVDFDAIAEGVADEKTFPWCGPSGFSSNAGGFEPLAGCVHVPAL